MLFTQIKRKFISFVYQPACCFCNDPIATPDLDFASSEIQSIVCSDCYSDVVLSQLDRCYFCGTEIHPLNPFGSRCKACRSWNSKFERVFAIGKYRDRLKETIIEIKRNSDETRAFQLGKLLGELADKFEIMDEIEVVVPVPSYWQRRWSRNGMHVAGVVSEGFCRVTGRQKLPNCLKCIRNTKKQSKLRPNQRIQNVRNAFKINPKYSVKNKAILLLDDVMTSGATVNECTKVLLEAGAASVFVAVAARASGVS